MITFQVCDVNNGLLSVRRVADAGYKVIFDFGGSYIGGKVMGERMWLNGENGMYTLMMWVRKEATTGEGFEAQGKIVAHSPPIP